jgi:hypothetical protein
MSDAPRARRRGGRWAFAIYLLTLGALAVVAALATVNDGDARRAGLAVLAGAGLLAGRKRGLLAVLPAALFGEWLIVALGIAGSLVRLLHGTSYLLARRRADDRVALASALATLPPDLLYALKIRAGREPLKTWHLVDMASRANPRTWTSLLGDDPREGAFDGPVLDLGDGLRSTLFAAEAAGLAAALAERFDRPVDPDVLALAACSVPLSAASEWVKDLEQAVEAVVGAPLIDVVECQSTFIATAAGRDVYRRAQVGYWARRLAIDDRQLVDAFRVHRLPVVAWQVLRDMVSA